MKHHSKKEILLYVTVPCVAALALVIAWAGFADIASALTNIFAGERSHAKTFLLLGYLIALSIFALALRGHEGRASASKAKRFLLGSLLVSYALNAASFFAFVWKHGFSVGDFVWSFRGGDISSTEFLHNHVLKGVIALFARFFGGGVYENVDAGHVFLGLLPDAFFVTAAISFLLSAIAVLVYFRHGLLAHVAHKSPRPSLYVLLYGLSSFVLLKNIIDGGLFDFAFLPAALVFAFLVCRPMGKGLRSLIIGLSLAYVSVIAYYFSVDQSLQKMEAISRIYRTVVAGIGFLALYYVTCVEKKRRFKILLVICAGVMMWYPVQNGLRALSFESMPISVADGAVVGVLGSVSDPRYTDIGRVGNLTYYKYIPVTEGERVGGIIRERGLLNNFYPVSIPWATCVPLDGSVHYSFRLSSFVPVEATSTPIVAVSHFDFVSFDHGLYSYDVSIAVNGCATRPLSLIQEFLSAQGSSEFFVSQVLKDRYVYSVE